MARHNQFKHSVPTGVPVDLPWPWYYAPPLNSFDHLMVYGWKLHNLGYQTTPDWPASSSEGFPGRDRRTVAPGHHIYYIMICMLSLIIKTFVIYLVNLILVRSHHVLLKLFTYPDVSFQDFWRKAPESIWCSMDVHRNKLTSSNGLKFKWTLWQRSFEP